MPRLPVGRRGHRALVPIGSRDYRQPYAAAGPDRFAIMPASERQAMHRMHFRRAMEALGPGRIGLAVTRIVLEELWPAEAGVSERRDARARTAVAIEFMIEGLDRLVALWGGR